MNKNENKNKLTLFFRGKVLKMTHSDSVSLYNLKMPLINIKRWFIGNIFILLKAIIKHFTLSIEEFYRESNM